MLVRSALRLCLVAGIAGRKQDWPGRAPEPITAGKRPLRSLHRRADVDGCASARWARVRILHTTITYPNHSLITYLASVGRVSSRAVDNLMTSLMAPTGARRERKSVGDGELGAGSVSSTMRQHAQRLVSGIPK